MEMEKLEEFRAILLPIRENKAVEMEIVCHRYEEEWKVSVCFTEMMKAVLDLKRLCAERGGRRIGICGGVAARLNEIINQPLLPFLVNVQHYSLTWKILLF